MLGLNPEDRANWLHTVAYAGAVASERGWQEYENAPLVSFGGGISELCPLSPKEGVEAELAKKVAETQDQAMTEAIELAAKVEQGAGDALIMSAIPLPTTLNL